MSNQHQYSVTVKWTGNKGNGTGTYTGYDRSHAVSIKNKPDILCSSDAAFRGDKNQHTPEDLLVASISSCHMLWYLHLCSQAGVVVTGYIDNAQGTMIVTPDGGGYFLEVTLYPEVTIIDISMVEKANELHEKANKLCFIANSCNFPIHHKSTCKIKSID
ncbi:MAG TPA: OsmC family protein [Chitinophagaceae bacterium]|nr:OsmC family protein [Chitinophagaceae bacterium]